MLFYSWQETAVMLIAAILVDWWIGDPRWPTHPVIWIGRWIGYMESRLHPPEAAPLPPASQRLRGVALTISTLALAFLAMGLILWLSRLIHPWLGYAVNTWFISTTIAVKGLKDAAMQVYDPLRSGRLEEARKYTGYIVGRDTSRLDESEMTRATVETVAENTVDAFVSPIFYALIGAAPLAMLYRAANTLDSMVGYKSDRYLHFGWASARWDDVMNWIPARLTGILLILTAAIRRGCSAVRAAKAVCSFASLHPSPNSGIPESAVAGALGIELGGVNVYHGRTSERARMGWPLRERRMDDILQSVKMLYGVSYFIVGGLLCALCWTLW
ncbi:adenosylcobinamide-phosphate synthase CbiB [Paenibacillus doosanensis]|uniref:Cobalamin biosynthesis protein CobD n=1 Tax=Paenibacillus konkukensis TaxID=2020716 RepID=A0ABY4RVY9_9BACL|nr:MULTISPECIES: adenosylcobinamide-phosphate synthase CbiB [Paenibacillus]MCS7460810.1 adenosylcobinamide-phosphate synthase CbiB [Paenibacillus doosanensis]UQZ85990.1 cobalamin biosynthesis protein [Paenibacillus konkukensis]